MTSMQSEGLVIDTIVCLTLTKWEAVSGQFGGSLRWRHGDTNSYSDQRSGGSHSGPTPAVYPRYHSKRKDALCDWRRQPAHPYPDLDQQSRDTHTCRARAKRDRLRRPGMIGRLRLRVCEASDKTRRALQS